MTEKPVRIARIWRGRTPRAKANEYASYLYEHGIGPRREGARRPAHARGPWEESEFVTISYWESVEAMSRFAGNDPSADPSSGARRRSS